MTVEVNLGNANPVGSLHVVRICNSCRYLLIGYYSENRRNGKFSLPQSTTISRYRINAVVIFDILSRSYRLKKSRTAIQAQRLIHKGFLLATSIAASPPEIMPLCHEHPL